MSRNIGFQKNVLKRNIEWNGKDYIFKRNKRNKFNEIIDGEYESTTYTIKGLFHNSVNVNSYIKVEEGEAARSQSKSVPMIVCLYSPVSSELRMDDKLLLNDKLYKVNGIDDINEEQVFLDISLEVIV